MSKYLDVYKKRILSNGEDVGDALSNDTIAFINDSFKNSTTYKLLEVESSKFVNLKTIDARVVQIERLGTLREIILRPDADLDVGVYVKIDNEWYLTIDKYGGLGASSIKLTIIKINQMLKWKDKNGVIKSYKCVASATDLGSKSKQGKTIIEFNKYDVKLPSGQLMVSVELNKDTNLIELNHRMIFGKNVYEVIGYDDISNTTDGYGIIQYTVKLAPRTSKDDFVNGIAFNDYKISDENIDSIDLEGNSIKEDRGGRLW